MNRTSLLFRLIFGASATLHPYEQMILDAVKLRLGSTTVNKLEAQLQLLPFLQRQDNDRIVAFFPKKGNSLPEEVLFENANSELMFATVELQRSDGRGRILVARLHAATRRFFSIEYDESPVSCGIGDGTELAISTVSVTASLDG